MGDTIVTNHAKKRAKERIGLKKSAVQRHADRAWDRGFTKDKASGSFRRYLDRMYFGHKTIGALRVYGEYVYLFSSDIVLITIMHIPTKYKRLAKKLGRENMGFDRKLYNERDLGLIDLEVLNDVSNVMDVTGYFNFAIDLLLDSGAIGIGVLTLQISTDGITFIDTATTLSAVGLLDKQSTVAKAVRLRVSTAQPGAGVLTGKFIAKA